MLADHHYDGLPALHAEALRTLYAEILRSADPTPATTLIHVLDRTWHAISQPRFKAVIEAWLAMANDPHLRSEIGPVVAEFAKLVAPEQLAPNLLRTKQRRTFILMARETMLGLALGRATSRGQPVPHEKLVLDQLRARARQFARLKAAAQTTAPLAGE